MSSTPNRRRDLANADADADATFDDTPIGRFVDPCLDIAKTLVVVFDDPFRGPCRGVVVRLSYASGAGESLKTDIRGAIRVKKTRGKFMDASYLRHGFVQERRVFLAPETAGGESASWQRLVNLGYMLAAKPPPFPDAPRKLFNAVQAFQADFGLEVTGTLDDSTRQRIEKEHADPTPWQNREWVSSPEPGPEDKNLKGSLS